MGPTWVQMLHHTSEYLETLRFEWDEKKNRSNRRKHGVWFEEAQSAFRDPNSRLFDDPEHSDDEDRFIFIGMSSTGSSFTAIRNPIQ
jgi:uncharacterized DUF497 family protein